MKQASSCYFTLLVGVKGQTGYRYYSNSMRTK